MFHHGKTVTIPKKIIAGDYIQWTLNATQDHFCNAISSPDWSVVYYLRTNKQQFAATVNSTAYEDGFKFTIASNVTENFSAGTWYYQAMANKSGAERQTIAQGTFEVIASTLYSGNNPAAFDVRTQLRKDFDAIEATIRAIANGEAVQEYKIGTRSLKKFELSELIMLRDRYKRDLVKEEKSQKIANGLGNPHNLYIRTRG